MFIIKLLSVSIAVCAVFASVGVNAKEPHPKYISITFDDVPIHGEFTLPAQSLKQINQQILATLNKYNIKATGFVNEGHIKNDPESLQSLLSDWHQQRHNLGNRTFSHLSYHKTDLDTYLADIQQGATTTQTVLGKHKQKFFRPPYLHAGDTNEAQQRLANGLKKLGLSLVPVTMENADYVFDAPYTARLKNKEVAAANSYQQQYLAFYRTAIRFLRKCQRKDV